jgi:putative spermidine/putrescine transport system substrate-binding protein
MYNSDTFGDQPPTSWDVVFEEVTLPDGKSNKGRIQAYDGAIYVADAALYLMSKRPELGIKDPYALTREQFDAAIELLRQQRTLINRYWHDAFVQMDDFTNEGVVASGSWPFMANYLKYFNNQPIEKVVPVEGATGWADSTMMHVNARNPNCAYAWLEWSLNPKLQGDLAWWFSNIPVRLDACEGNELLGPEGCKLNGVDDFDKIYWWRTPTADCGDGRMECVPYHEWVTSYVAVIGGR